MKFSLLGRTRSNAFISNVLESRPGFIRNTVDDRGYSSADDYDLGVALFHYDSPILIMRLFMQSQVDQIFRLNQNIPKNDVSS